MIRSEDIPLRNKSDNFERGKTDKFKIELPGEIQEIYKVRIGHDGGGRFSGWHLNQLSLAPVAAQGSLQYDFVCDRWLASGEDDGELQAGIDNKKRIK